VSAPRIALGGVVRPWDGADRTGLNAAYVRSVIAAGGVPLMLSPLMGPSYAARALDGVDGLILTGGEDMDPAWYNAERSPLCNPPSRQRDLFELALFAIARQRELPILGICRGIQVINVALGGSLYQDLLAAEALGSGPISVNSFHHQAIRDLAPALIATGWSEDGLIEAVESGEGQPWMLAVQWHPEEMYAETDAPDHGLFKALIERAAATAAASVDS
jgi:putative glutamine amidotransferase